MMKILFLRGTKAENDLFVGDAGTITIDTTNNVVRLHDGVTVGGHLLPNQDLVFSAIEDKINDHNASGDHDHRYYQKVLENEVLDVAGNVSVKDNIRIGDFVIEYNAQTESLDFYRYTTAE